VVSLAAWTLLGFAITTVLVLVVRRAHTRAGSAVRFRIADWLTILRLALTAPTAWLLVRGHYLSASIAYGVLIATDVADGIIARRRNETTPFGMFLDPLADILSTFAMFTVFVVGGWVPLWLYLLLAVRYLMLCVGALVLSRTSGPMEFRATVPGKIVGVVQAAGVLWIMHAAAGEAGRVPGDGALFAFLGIGFLSIVVSQAIIGYRHVRRAGARARG
jgi:phosphatidylglycerophosphate synthase